MKKLMMFAAAMTIVGGAYAGECAPGSNASPCDTPVWDFVMKGKTANGIEKGYKAVYAISYKGAIVGNTSQKPVEGTGGTSVQTKTIIEVNGAVTTNTAAMVYVPGAALIASGSETNGAAALFAVTTNAEIKTVSYTTNGVAGVTSAPVPAVKNTWVMYSEETVITESIDYTNAVPFVGNELKLPEIRTKLSTSVPYRLMLVDETVITQPDLSDKCCLDTFTVYVYDKVDKDLIVFEDQEVLKMSVFGKGLVKELKPGGSATLESDVMWNLVGDEEIALQFVGFGKAKYSLSKGGTSGSVCNPVTEEPCVKDYDWPSWSGWFTGFFGPETDDSDDLSCAGDCIAVAGGTWSAKLNKKLSAASDVEGAIYRKFKVSYLFDDEE